tara:strand:+ start:1169 stop:2182 length:1014 start_codon:yes stop_codon:yes gene_type:complete
MELRKSELKNRIVESIYFGGGTPSVLKINDIQSLIERVKANFSLDENCEITLELNPDDIEDGYLESYKNIGINRLSIGVQSFFNSDLKLINRAHDSKQAINVIEKAKKIFKNFSIDLIYGIPETSLETWAKNIQIALSLSPPHISAYALTIEPKTVLNDWVNKNKIKLLDEESILKQFNYMVNCFEKEGYDHYEISNFGKNNFYSKNNSSYWKGNMYLGIGPSAHSYDGDIRSWNISNNNSYINSIEKNILPIKREKLSKVDKHNEYIMTGLRTIWGVSSSKIYNDFGEKYYLLLKTNAKKHLRLRNLFWDGDTLKASKKARFLVDGIASDLFLINL